jgi:protein-tyrosine kinase
MARIISPAMPPGTTLSRNPKLNAILAGSPLTQLAEAFRVARLGATFSLLDAPPRTLVVTSTSEGEARSTVAANLAAAFAESG